MPHVVIPHADEFVHEFAFDGLRLRCVVTGAKSELGVAVFHADEFVHGLSFLSMDYLRTVCFPCKTLSWVLMLLHVCVCVCVCVCHPRMIRTCRIRMRKRILGTTRRVVTTECRLAMSLSSGTRWAPLHTPTQTHPPTHTTNTSDCLGSVCACVYLITYPRGVCTRNLQVIEKLGWGHFSTVWLVADLVANRYVVQIIMSHQLINCTVCCVSVTRLHHAITCLRI